METAGILDRVRASCAEVVRRARSVRIDDERLDALARELARGAPAAPDVDPSHHRLATTGATLALVITLDAINFGSGWFPLLRKRPGLSGYLSVATCLRERFDARGPWTAHELVGMRASCVAEVLEQEPTSEELRELLRLYARALRDLGAFLLERFGGRFEGPVEAARGSAEKLVGLLLEMPLYRDVARYEELEVPFLKRAQITAADLALALGGEGLGRFDDLDRLTLFADNLVPHVLRMEGVLWYAPALARRIDSEELLEPGSPEEVEIRAAAVEAVERCVGAAGRHGLRIRPHALDGLLWNRGQTPAMKSHPRHRTRCPYY
jgi:hypothetical protein